MNPVRAGLVRHPGEYRWSSYRFNAHGISMEWVTPHDAYNGLGSSQYQRQIAYQELFESNLGKEIMEEIRLSTNSNYVLGNDRFKDEIEQHLDRRVRPGKNGRRVLP